jgi:hypothetical protein
VAQLAWRELNRSACERVALWIGSSGRSRHRRPFTRDEDGYFWGIRRIDDAANVSTDRLSAAMVESAIVDHGQGRGGGRDRLTRTRDRAICAHTTLEGCGSNEVTSECPDLLVIRETGRRQCLAFASVRALWSPGEGDGVLRRHKTARVLLVPLDGAATRTTHKRTNVRICRAFMTFSSRVPKSLHKSRTHPGMRRWRR